MSTPFVESTARIPSYPSVIGPIRHGIKKGYEALCQGADLLGRRYVQVTDKACCGNLRAAAIARIALNILVGVGLHMGLICASAAISPFLGLCTGVLGTVVVTKILTEACLREYNVAKGSPITTLTFSY